MASARLSSKEKYIARAIFKARAINADGAVYQSLLWAILRLRFPDFVPIKQGGGDGGNDGYQSHEGIYYQCSAPEEPDQEVTRKRVAAKVEEDFLKLWKNWNDTRPINEYIFAYNDKYRGIPKELSLALDRVKKASSLPCRFFLTKDLEDEFVKLSPDEIYDLDAIGQIPSPSKIEMLDYTPLSDVIHHIMGNHPPISVFGNLTTPKLDEKIVLNKLGRIESSFLQTAYLQVGAIDEYFERNSEYAKQDVRNRFAESYEKLKAESRDGESLADRSNRIFWALLEEMTPVKPSKRTKKVDTPQKRKSAKEEREQQLSMDIPDTTPEEEIVNCPVYRARQNAVFVLMSYYFESCDWGEGPVLAS